MRGPPATLRPGPPAVANHYYAVKVFLWIWQTCVSLNTKKWQGERRGLALPGPSPWAGLTKYVGDCDPLGVPKSPASRLSLLTGYSSQGRSDLLFWYVFKRRLFLMKAKPRNFELGKSIYDPNANEHIRNTPSVGNVGCRRLCWRRKYFAIQWWGVHESVQCMLINS